LQAHAEAIDRQPGGLFFDHCEPGHGRIQRWQLKACAVEPDAVDFPFARSVVIVRLCIAAASLLFTLRSPKTKDPGRVPRA